MKRYKIREGSFMDWFISITAPMAKLDNKLRKAEERRKVKK